MRFPEFYLFLQSFNLDVPYCHIEQASFSKILAVCLKFCPSCGGGSLKALRAVRDQNVVMSRMGFRIKNHCAGEGQEPNCVLYNKRNSYPEDGILPLVEDEILLV
jgi:hypothetical protein